VIVYGTNYESLNQGRIYAQATANVPAPQIKKYYRECPAAFV